MTLPQMVLEQIIDNYAKHGVVDISLHPYRPEGHKGQDVFYAQFVIDLRPIGMTDEKAVAANAVLSLSITNLL